MTFHEEKALELFRRGYNCSQAVMLAFCDVMDMDEKTALKISSSFGGGIGRMREVCGAVSGMFMVAGMLYGYTDADDSQGKNNHYKRIQQLASQFKELNGSYICRELLKDVAYTTDHISAERNEEFYKLRPCERMVCDAARLMDQYIENN
ncbi:MAG: C-GCAxxG-C-C family protein [Clostridia bacterium]|nr:C-GCAxxG-C-C family protein [Clostridia bacterium]